METLFQSFIDFRKTHSKLASCPATVVMLPSCHARNSVTTDPIELPHCEFGVNKKLQLSRVEKKRGRSYPSQSACLSCLERQVTSAVFALPIGLDREKLICELRGT